MKAQFNTAAVVLAKRCLRYLLVAAAFTPVMCGDGITLPLDDGNILIHARFIRINQFSVYVPELALSITNQTSSSWATLKLQFDIGGLCNGEFRQWTLPVVTSLGWAKDHQVVKEYTDSVILLFGKVDGCKAEIIKASLILAENSKTRIDGATGERVDLEKQLRDLKIKREAEAAAQAEEERRVAEAQAEEERKAAEAQAKKDAAEAARRKQLVAEQKRKQAEVDAQRAKMRAEEDAKATEERRKIRATCTIIYQNTIDKKVRDLTVREDQQVRACQELGFYPPQ